MNIYDQAGRKIQRRRSGTLFPILTTKIPKLKFDPDALKCLLEFQYSRMDNIIKHQQPKIYQV